MSQRLLHQLRPLPQCEQPYAWILDSRNKQSVVLNLKDPAQADALRTMLTTADVVIENYRPGTMEKLGLGEGDRAAILALLSEGAVEGTGVT